MQRFNYDNQPGVDGNRTDGENQQGAEVRSVENEPRGGMEGLNNASIVDLFQRLMQQSERREEMLLAAITSRQDVSTTQSYQVMPDLAKTIPTFDGEGSTTVATEWLRNVESVANLHQWPDNFKLESARTHLVGAAQYWYSSRNFENWDHFRTAFQKTFGGQLSVPELWKRMQSRMQVKGESTMKYFHEKVNYCQGLKFNFDDIKRQVLIGLWSRQMCSVLMSKKHTDLDELLADIREYEEVEAERIQYHTGLRRDSSSSKSGSTGIDPRKGRVQASESTSRGRIQTTDSSGTDTRNSSVRPNTSQSTPLLSRENMTTTQVRRPASSPRFNQAGEPRCFNCNDFGHVARDCPKPPRVRHCSACNQDGHSQKNCPASRQSDQIMSVNRTGEQTITKYLKWVKIDNQESFQGLIDSGSSCCTIRASAAIKMGGTLRPVKERLTGFGEESSTTVQPIGQITANLTIDGVCGESTNLYVVPDSVQPVDILVGQSWIDLPHVTLIKIDEKLMIRHRDENPFGDIEASDERPRVKLMLAEDRVLHKQSVNFVKVVTSSACASDILVTSRREELPILISPSTDGQFILPVINTTDKDIHRKQKECVARGESVNIVGSIVPDRQPSKRPIMLSELKVDESAPQQQVQQLLALLNQFRDCFAMNLSELGCTNMATMHIEEIPGSKPVQTRPYRTTAKEREAMHEIIQEWKRNGIVTDTRSPYASPALLVQKKTGEYRLVVDYRRLNAQTVKDRFPLPHIDYQLEQLSGCNIFTILDMAHGYLQIPLDEESKKKTAFVTSDESGQFERMIFGLANAPSEFQRAMCTALGPLRNTIAMCYMDDLLIPAKSWDELLERLRQVLEALRKANFTLRLSKCEFGRREIEYLGFIISEKGTRPGTKKTSAVSSFPQPRNVHEVRRFLGLTSFFRRYVDHYAQRAEPLTRLTRKDEPFKWTEDQDKSFSDLKTALSSSPVLQLYNPEARTEVHTDASAEGLAGILLQEGHDGKLHLVYCVSKRTTPAEKGYHSSKLELAAIIWTVNRLRQFLIGIPFTIYTDCQALVYLNEKRTTNPQVARWYTMLQEYEIVEVKHRPGVKMAHVDAISRAPETSDTGDESIEDVIFQNIDVMLSLTIEDQVLLLQQSDEELRSKINVLKKPLEERTKAEKERTQEMVLHKGLLYKEVRVDGQLRRLFVIPDVMRKSLAVRAHDLSGHFGVERTVAKLKEHYWFPTMRRYIRHHISHCFECLMNKIPSGKQPGLLQPITPGTRPFEVINMDHLGPFVTSSKGNQYILLIIDNLTKFVHLYPVRNTSTQYVLRSLDSLISARGLPARIITDRGSCFTSHAFDEYCKTRGIAHTLNATRHPRANGQIERVNRTVLPMIAMTIENPTQHDWDKKIQQVERDLNNAANKTTGKSPFELLHGYKPRFYDGHLQVVTTDPSTSWQSPSELQAKARETIMSKNEKIKQRFDKKHYVGPEYTVGQVVVMRCVPTHTGESTKTQRKYRGPLVITARVSRDTYRVTQLQPAEKGRFFSSVVHVSLIKPWGSKMRVNDGDEVYSDEEEDPNMPEESNITEDDHTGNTHMSQRKRRVPQYLQDYQM